MTQVFLRIYEFKLFTGFTEYHSEIIAFDKSFSYSDEGVEISTVQNKDGLDGYTLVATYDLGYADIYEYEFEEFYAPDIMMEYTADDYQLFHRNCRFFSLEILNILKPSDAEIGRRVLQDLNRMSTNLSRVVQPVRSFNNTVFKIISAVLLITSVYYGKILPMSGNCKDYTIIVLLIVHFFVMAIYCLWR